MKEEKDKADKKAASDKREQEWKERKAKEFEDDRKKAAYDFTYLWDCHSTRDSLNRIDPADMKTFSEEVVMKII